MIFEINLITPLWLQQVVEVVVQQRLVCSRSSHIITLLFLDLGGIYYFFRRLPIPADQPDRAGTP